MPSFVKTATLIAIAAASISQAALANNFVLSSGNAQVAFSTNALQSFQSAGIGVSALSPATYAAPVISFSASDSGIGYGSSSQVSSLTANGGLSLASSTVNGARIDITNIKVDTATGIVSGDGVSQSWNNATLGNYTGTSFKNLQLFTSTLSGNADISKGNGSISLNLADLHFSNAAIPVLGNALGVPAFLQNLIFPSLNVGSATVTASFSAVTLPPTPSVPEPGTWLLMALGLVGLLTGSRRARLA